MWHKGSFTHVISFSQQNIAIKCPTENERCSAASSRSRPNPRFEIFSTSLGRLCQRNKFKGEIRNSPNQNAVTISCYDSSPNVWTLLSSVFISRLAEMAHSPPTNVARVRFPLPSSYAGWVCLFSTQHREVFSEYSGFPSPQKPAFVCVNFQFTVSPISARTISHLNKINSFPFQLYHPYIKLEPGMSKRWVSNRNFSSCISFQLELRQTWSDILVTRHGQTGERERVFSINREFKLCQQ